MRYRLYKKHKDSGVDGLGEIPENWQVKRLKHLVTSPLMYGANEAALDTDKHQPRFIRITDVNDDGTLRESTFRSLQEDIAKPYLLMEGDILLARSGATVGKSFIYSENWGNCCFAGYLIKASIDKEQIYPNWVYKFTDTQYYWEWIQSIQIQATIQNVSAEKYNNFSLCFPPKSEQAQIITFLDRETAKIDTLIAKQEALIRLLQEKRTAVISHAVTKGLNPHAPLKDSGIEWLGQIPVHWEVKRLKNVIVETLKNGIFKKRNEFGKGSKLINVSDLFTEDGFVDIDSLERVVTNDLEKTVYKVQKGDIFFVRSSLKLEGIGVSSCVIDDVEDTVFECHIVKASPNTSTISPKYLIRYLNSSMVSQRFVQLAKTTTMTTIDQDKLSSISVFVPPINEQYAIDEYLDKNLSKLGSTIKKVEDSIILMKERRTALISAAVTGKIDVRHTIPQGTPS